MSGSSSFNTYESEDESNGWLMTSETSVDDELSDELTLLNGDEDCDNDTSSFEALIKLSMRLKKQYNLREAAVQLERCDKIWDTMQLVKQMQIDNEFETAQTANRDNEEGEREEKYTPPTPLRLPEGANSMIPYIKYQPVQGNGNNALPNFYLAVKSQKKLYNCVTCGKQYSEERSLRLHSQKEHGIMMPKAVKKNRRNADIKPASQDSTDHKTVNNSASKDRDNGKSRLTGTSKNSTEQQQHSPRKHDRKTDDGVSLTVKEPKREPERSSTDDIPEKPHVCSICSNAYTYQRGLTTHIMNAHEKTLKEAKLISSRGNTIRTKRLRKKEIPQKVVEIKKESVKKEGAETLPKLRWRYTCKSCGKSFAEKTTLRSHARKIHNIVIPLQRKPPLSIEGQKKIFAHYTSELRNPSGQISRLPVPVIKTDDKSFYRRIRKNETQQSRTMRSGRLIGDTPNVNRPRRACAAHMSYNECTKDEEEVLQKALIFSNTANPQASTQNTPCFLCKKSFVDIRKHLIDYHRINCPETILPLATNVVDSEKDTASIASSEIASSETSTSLPEKIEKTRKKRVKVEETNVEINGNNEYIRILGKSHRSRWSPKKYQCVLCSYKFARRSHIQKHLDRYTINGVVEDHIFEHQRKRQKILKDPPVDPLALTDFAESSRSESQPTDAEDVDPITGRKRKNSSEDDRLSSDYKNHDKRRKLEQPEEFMNPGSDSTSDSVQYNNERKTVLVMAETDSLSDQEEKTANPRDTRDSSDRDSGIGISITIKKRNNSYEVVEKDSGDDDKSKDFEHSKDDNTSSDSSSDVTPVVFVNDDQESRRREILNSLDYSVEENAIESVRREDCDVVDGFAKKTEEESCSSDDKDTNYCRKEEEHYGKNACASLPGNVPSLKVMCATVLKNNQLTNLNSNHLNSHKCPVCSRFYPTERDVTVHMLEHKVSRSDFRATRVHAIPSSALRRYGRRSV